jgi:signal transduction histidine kinase
VGLVTLPLPAPGLNKIATAAVSAVALALGILTWLAPWETWPARASLGLVPPAFALIALGNAFGGSNLHAYGVFFVVAFVWIGMAHPPRMAVALAPLAAAAYVLPLFFLPGNLGAGLSSAAITVPVCVLVGEGIAWGVARLEQIELALRRERDRTEHLRELDEMKDAFLSAVSHELRTLITICRGHLDVLEEGADGREVRAVKETLLDELDLMVRATGAADHPCRARPGQRSLPQMPVAASAACSPSLVGSSDHTPATVKTSSSLIMASAPVAARDSSICVGLPDCWCSPDSPW